MDCQNAQELDDAHAENLHDKGGCDLVSVENALGRNLGQMHDDDADQRRVEVEGVHDENYGQVELEEGHFFCPSVRR